MSRATSTWIIVFDVNVFLDVAVLLGEPFDRDRFEREVSARLPEVAPHPDRRIDALRAVAPAARGRITKTVSAEV